MWMRRGTPSPVQLAMNSSAAYHKSDAIFKFLRHASLLSNRRMPARYATSNHGQVFDRHACLDHGRTSSRHASLNLGRFLTRHAVHAWKQSGCCISRGYACTLWRVAGLGRKFCQGADSSPLLSAVHAEIYLSTICGHALRKRLRRAC
jgi:hypothetical protein